MNKIRIYMMETDLADPEKTDKVVKRLFRDIDTVDPSLYRMVYEEYEENRELDYLYAKYNSYKHIRNSKIRCMSVSDILFIQEDGTNQGKYFLCMRIGWKELKLSPEDETELNRDKGEKQKDIPEHIMKKELYFDFRFVEGGFCDDECSPFGLKTTIIYNERDREAIGDTNRRPYYRIRGKRITRELARKIIRLTDSYLHGFVYRDNNWIRKVFDEVGAEAKTSALMEYIENDWFPIPYEVPCGWCHPDGYIGINAYVGNKNPFLHDILDDWAYLLESLTDDETDQLDLVLIMTKQDEFLHPYMNFIDEVVCGFRIKGRSIEILGAPKARLLYKRYDNCHGEHDLTGPLRDYRDIYPDKRKMCMGEEYDRGLWGPGISSCAHTFSWGYDNDDLADRTTKVDKNSPMYYGYPDYNFKEGPMTTDDMREFAEAFKTESDAVGDNPEHEIWWEHRKENGEACKYRYPCHMDADIAQKVEVIWDMEYSV